VVFQHSRGESLHVEEKSVLVRFPLCAKLQQEPFPHLIINTKANIVEWGIGAGTLSDKMDLLVASRP
jgi:hypothetical protein